MGGCKCTVGGRWRAVAEVLSLCRRRVLSAVETTPAAVVRWPLHSTMVSVVRACRQGDVTPTPSADGGNSPFIDAPPRMDAEVKGHMRREPFELTSTHEAGRVGGCGVGRQAGRARIKDIDGDVWFEFFHRSPSCMGVRARAGAARPGWGAAPAVRGPRGAPLRGAPSHHAGASKSAPARLVRCARRGGEARRGASTGVATAAVCSTFRHGKAPSSSVSTWPPLRQTPVSRWVMGAAGAVRATKEVGAAGAAEAAPHRTGGWVIAAGMTGWSTSREAQRGQACHRPLHAAFFCICVIALCLERA